MIIAIHFPKGGSCKSTTAWALAHTLAKKFDVLVIDVDSQATLTNALTSVIPPLTTYEVMKGQATVGEAAVLVAERVRLVAASTRLAGLDAETAGDIDRPYLLQDALKDASGIVIIDTPPAVNVLTVASLVAATCVLTPIATEPNAWEQVGAFERTYDQIRKRLNPDLQWVGVLPSRFDGRNRLDQEVLAALHLHFGERLFAPIRSTVRLREAMAQGRPTVNEDYFNFTNELLRRLNHDQIPKEARFSGRE